jgi:hypothetical protein
VKIKLDENLGVRTAEIFRSAGHDVATTAEQGLQSAGDAAIFDVCASEGRVAVLRVPDLPSGRDLIAAAMRLVAAMEADDITGRLWIVGVTRVRKYKPDDLI